MGENRREGKRFRYAVYEAPVAMVIVRGKDNVVEMVNEPYLELINKTEQEFLRKPLFESLPDAEQAVGTTIKDIYKTETAYFDH